MNDLPPVKRSRWFYFWEYNNGRLHIDVEEEFRKMMRDVPSLRDVLRYYFRVSGNNDE